MQKVRAEFQTLQGKKSFSFFLKSVGGADFLKINSQLKTVWYVLYHVVNVMLNIMFKTEG